MATNLVEEHRVKLDGIVQQMITNKEPDENIQWVVNDFKQKYAGPDIQPQIPLHSKGITPTINLDGQGNEVQPEGEQGFVSRIGDDLSKRGTNIADTWKSDNKALTAFDKIGSTMGQVAGGINDVLVKEPMVSVGNAIPDETFGPEKTVGKAILNTPIGQMGIKALNAGAEVYRDFRNKNPEVAKMIEGTANLFAVTQIVPQAKKVIDGAKGLKADAFDYRLAKMPTKAKEGIISNIDKSLNPVVQKGFAGTTGFKSKTAGDIATELNDKKIAIKSIISDKQNLKLTSGKILPDNVEDMAEAVEQTKRSIWSNEIAPAIGKTSEGGFRVSVKSSIQSLDSMAGDEVLKVRKPEVVAQAKALRDRLVEVEHQGGFTPEKAQQWISEVNKELVNFYKKVNPELDTRLAMDAVVANNMRDEFTRIVDLATDAGIADAKSKYKALLSIEGDINKVRNRMIKKTFGQNAPSYFDLGTDWGIIHSAFTGNMPGLAGAAGAKAVKAWQQYNLSPDTYVGRMFRNAEGLVDKQNKIRASIPKQGRPIPKQLGWEPSMGMGEPIQGPSVVPPIPQPTTRALPPPPSKIKDRGLGRQPYEANMLDRSNKPVNLENFTKDEIKQMGYEVVKNPKTKKWELKYAGNKDRYEIISVEGE